MLVEYDLGALPGRWRPGPVVVNDTASSEVVYEGPPSDDVPALIDALVADLAHEGILAPEFCSIEEYLGRHSSATATWDLRALTDAMADPYAQPTLEV